MKTKHTPGPWRHEAIPANVATSAPRWVVAPGGRRIADVRTQRDETDANARLIAAAPDMLTALQTIALHITSLDPEGVRELCNRAIAEAIGEE